MIRKLTLANWRNYEDVEIELGTGTTFVVASNGLGKTSLVEAARFALFGTPLTDSDISSIPSGLAPRQRGSNCFFRTPPSDYRRTHADRKDAALAPVSGDPDGRTINEVAFERAVRDAYGAEIGVPGTAHHAGGVMPTGHSDEALELEARLGHYFGVDGLQRAIDLLTENLRTPEKQIRQIKVSNAATARQLAELEARGDGNRRSRRRSATRRACGRSGHPQRPPHRPAQRCRRTRRGRRAETRGCRKPAEVLEPVAQDNSERRSGERTSKSASKRQWRRRAACIENARIHMPSIAPCRPHQGKPGELGRVRGRLPRVPTTAGRRDDRPRSPFQRCREMGDCLSKHK